MKNGIIAAVMLSFLIGCSFSKESSKNETKGAEKSVLSIGDKIQQLDLESLKFELNNLSENEYADLKNNADDYLNLALERGSYKVLTTLIDLGLSAFQPDKNGSSFYNQLPSNDLHKKIVKSLFLESKKRAGNYISSNQWAKLSSAINDFEISCDAALIHMVKLRNRNKMIDFIKQTPACKYSAISQDLRNTFAIYFNEYIQGDFENDSILLDLYEIISSENRLIRIPNNYESSFFVSPIVILKELKSLKPKPISATIDKLEKFSSPSDTSIVYRWKSNEIQMSNTLAKIDSEVSGVTASTVGFAIRRHYSKMCKSIFFPGKDLPEQRCLDFRHLDTQNRDEDIEVEE